jgi:tRNA dimethylallyltransferase
MPTVNPKKIIIVLGPTASGKTELALKLAKKFNCFIISADSRQVYQDMNVGTAKPKGRITNYKLGIKGIETAYIVKGVPHFLMDYVEPNKSFTLADWLKVTKKLLNSKTLNSKFKIPIICGGTGLYISALVDNYKLPKGQINLNLRTKLAKRTLRALLNKLKKIDLATYKLIDKSNKRRVIRALEYVLTNHLSFTSKVKNQLSPYEFLQIGLNQPREKLYQRINSRVDQMLKKGLIPETRKLIKKYDPSLPALSSIGYKQIREFLNGSLTKEQAIEFIKRDSRHYAKRQLTWFKRDKQIHWVNNYPEAKKIVNTFLQK